MINLQDELAGLNHRLDHKLDDWRRLHRRHRSITLRLGYAALLLILCFYGEIFKELRAVLTSPATAESPNAILALFAAVVAPLAYCAIKTRHYWNLLQNGQELRDRLYSSCMDGETKNADVKSYHNEFGKLLMKEINGGLQAD